MRIDSSGNVGIGESNTQELLHLTATTPVFRMQGGSRTYQQFVSGTDFVIRDVNAGLNRVTLDSSGNLLVGTTVSPASGDPTSVRYGIGVQAGSLSSTTTCTAGVITNVLNMANAVSGVNGAGLWLISVIRGGASYATHFTGVFGVNSSSMVLYQTIQSAGITVSVNGLQLRLNVSTTDGYRVNAIPLSINT